MCFMVEFCFRGTNWRTPSSRLVTSCPDFLLLHIRCRENNRFLESIIMVEPSKCESCDWLTPESSSERDLCDIMVVGGATEHKHEAYPWDINLRLLHDVIRFWVDMYLTIPLNLLRYDTIRYISISFCSILSIHDQLFTINTCTKSLVLMMVEFLWFCDKMCSESPVDLT